MSYTGSLTVRWRMSTESDLNGYRVYHGTVSGTYTNYQDVGLVPGSTAAPYATLSGFARNSVTYFAVTAYDVTGNESTFSAEIPATMVIPLINIQRTMK